MNSSNKDLLQILSTQVGDLTLKELDVMKKLNDGYIRDPLSMFVPSIGICEYSLSPNHKHPGYMFVISLHSGGDFIVEGEKIKYDSGLKNPLICMSPEIEHQEIVYKGEQNYIAIFISKEFFEKECRENGYVVKTLKSLQLESSHNLISYCRLFISEYNNKFTGLDKILNSLSMLIVQELLRIIYLNSTDYRSLSTSSMDDIIQYIYSNFHKKILVEDLASKTGYSESHFARKFRKVTGRTPIDFLLDVRLEKAKSLLSIDDFTITEVSEACGFSSPSHFSSQFKNRYSQSPKAYKESLY